MTEAELYKKLGILTKSKERWMDSIPHIASLLASESTKIKAKALWLLGEMGLKYPEEMQMHIPKIATFLDSHDDLLRERALNAMGRIGRARFETVKPWWGKLFELANDSNPRVRLAFIWASENIATNAPEAYASQLQVYAALLNDNDDKVRMEAPEMFRVLGKRTPQQVKPYLDTLQWLAENDPHPVVRIHCSGAIRPFITPHKETGAGMPRRGKLSIAPHKERSAGQQDGKNMRLKETHSQIIT